jgi:hypothetical protein
VVASESGEAKGAEDAMQRQNPCLSQRRSAVAVLVVIRVP